MTKPVGRPHKKPGAKRKPVPTNLEQIEILAGFGLTEEEIAAVLGVCRTTLVRWKKRSKDFEEALKRGKAKADLLIVKSLYSRATEEHDTTAQIFWLKNRQPDRWRDRRDMTLAGPDGESGIEVQVTVIHTRDEEKGNGKGNGKNGGGAG